MVTFRDFSRKKLIQRLLRLPSEPHRDEPGLILLQIDGLSRVEFERAVAAKRLPFLSKLLRREGYTLHSLYSGIPSTTPAVQAELFYRKKCAVPAFDFVDREQERYCSMVDPTVAAEVEQQLEKEAEGIASGGSAYSNVYGAGSAEPHLCAAHLGWGELLADTGVWRLAVIVLLHIAVVFRILGMALIEFGLALWDAVRGSLAESGLRQEATALCGRIFISIVLREWITLGIQVDLVRGLPVVQANFLGYDEQCHRRGPRSAYARWTLKGIDGCIHRIWSTQRSADRRYHLWVYSDHGQEQTHLYKDQTGRLLGAAVEDILGPLNLKPEDNGKQAGPPCLTDKGPVAHLYLPPAVATEDIDRIAQTLVDAGIPLVMRSDPTGVIAWVLRGRFQLPKDAAEVVGQDHPFLGDIGDDLVRLAQHKWAGSLVLIGWERDRGPFTFAPESGSHGGPGPTETHAFILLPSDAHVDLGKGYLRPGGVYDAAMQARPAPGRRQDADDECS